MGPIRLYVALGVIVRYWFLRMLIALALALLALQLPYGHWLVVLPLGWLLGIFGRAVARADAEVTWSQAVVVGVLSTLLAPLIGFPLAALGSVARGEAAPVVLAVAYSLLPLAIVVTICRLHVRSRDGRSPDPFRWHHIIAERLRRTLQRT